MRQVQNKSILDNGITVLTESVDFVRSCAIGVFIRAGTRDEAPDSEGIAHFIEHLIFKGTETRSAFDIVDEIESCGGNLNAYTSKESTCIYARVLHEQTEGVLEIFADILQNSLFPEQEIELERDVVLEELFETEDTPSDYSHDDFVRRMFPRHPIGRNILGTKDSISLFNRAKVIDFINRHYSGDRLVVVAAGYVEHGDFLEGVKRYFSSIPGGHGERRSVLASQPSVGYWHRRRNVSQAQLIIGRHAYPYTIDRRMEYMLLNASLSSGMSSRLFQNIREKHGIAYNIYSFVDMFSDAGLFGVYAGIDAARAQEVLDLVMKEFRSIVEDGLEPDEFARVKKMYEGNILMGAESMYSRMDRMGRNELQFGRFITYDESLHKITEVRREDIRDLARDLLDPKSFRIYLMSSGKKAELAIG